MNRRQALAALAAGAASACSSAPTDREPEVASTPSYLADFAGAYAASPHQAATEWFRASRFGMFLHYGLYSQLGGEWQGKQVVNVNDASKPVAEWVQFHAQIPVAEYAELADTFTAADFDAEFITDLALEAEMKYVNITTRHHDSFCLFRTAETDFQSLHTPARRDLVGELAEACARKGLGLFLYYSHGRDWKHPHAPSIEWGGPSSRPAYDRPQPEYADGTAEWNLDEYLSFMKRQITELLTQYGPIAGIWLDGEGVIRNHGRANGGLEKAVEEVKLLELYDHVRELQPQCLVSYKQGVTGTEDFVTPERKSFGLEKLGRAMEINTTLQAHSWGYNKFTKSRKSADDVMELLELAASLPASLLINTGPMGAGGIVEEEAETMREMGRRIRADGWPTA